MVNSEGGMGQARIKQRASFQQDLITEWEGDGCVNFAIALARDTSWLLHVVWWVPSTNPDEDVSFEKFKPLRVYVADNSDNIFDARGIFSIVEFNNRIIRNLADRYGSGAVRTRFYSEKKLFTLPLASLPDEAKIERALATIRANEHYLARISSRPRNSIPAHLAAPFGFGRCAAFAQALHEITGLTPVALLAIRFAPAFEGTRRGATGYFHSVVLHDDGIAEDCWGKATLGEIADRFGVLEYQVSGDEQRVVTTTLSRNSPDLYQQALQEARGLIKTYRPSL
jgi:hypothetical protein